MGFIFEYNPLRSTTLAGKILPLLSSLFLSADEIRSVVKNVSSAIQVLDLLILVSAGWLLVPAVGIIYDFAYPYIKVEKERVFKRMGTTFSSADDSDDEEEEEEQQQLSPYELSYVKLIAQMLSQVARLSLLVYACDCFVVAFETMDIGLDAKQWTKVTHVFAKIVYTSWFASVVQNFKSYFIRRALNRAPKNCDKIKLINNICDTCILALLLIKILKYLSLDTDYAVNSLFAVGTTGGLIISLASQEVAKNVMSGIEMASSSRFYTGDHVHFGDGTKGFIKKMGFLRTKILQYDGSVIDIENSKLSGQQVINMSRVGNSRIVTTLRFKYQDIQQLPDVLEKIKAEIEKSCPTLITKGKPFRAKITSFERDHVEATVDCRFELPPFGDEFWGTRQDMFLAIDKAVTSCGLEFAKPGYFLKEEK